MKFSASYKLATLVFESSPNQNDIFGANGLPLTPPSITMIGNYHSFVNSFNSSLKQSPYLTCYLDCIRSKNEKISLVFEHYLTCFSTNPTLFSDIKLLVECGLNALYHLHYVVGCVHGLITPDSFLYTGSECKYKLTHWALNIITNSGQLCNQSILFPDDICFLSPEQLLLLKPSRKSDVWSLGLSILCFMFPENFKKFFDPFKFVKCENSHDVFSILNIDISCLSELWIQFFNVTLHRSPDKRSSIKDLMKLMQISPPDLSDSIAIINDKQRLLELESKEDLFEINNFISIHDFYYLSCITFPSKDRDKEQHDLPPILSIPRLAVLESESSKQDRNENTHQIDEIENELNKLVSTDLSDIKIIRISSNKDFKLLPVETINERLLKLSHEIFTPVILSSDIFSKDSDSISETLPLSIREQDFDYQCERVMIFKALLNGFPFLRNQLIAEAKTDICPLYRSQIWASLLNVRWSDKLLYEKIDKLKNTSTDRQIAVDIPRCHQYNDLLASSEGHLKLTRVLKAWLAFNESNGEVYWQGLDSLAAPFIILNFNNEPQAFACFHLFIKKYLRGFFQKDNSAAIQEYLALFQIVITYIDPVLSSHLDSLGFVPDLYAISWFLTMFTHILPLYQVLQLWDTLILGNDSFPLFIGLAILHQLRDRILDFSFNDCILIFSDLPQIDIDRCVRNSVKFFCSTPKSITKRGFWPLKSLKDYPRLPRIDLEDLLIIIDKRVQSNTNNDDNCNSTLNNMFVFVDCRSKDDISKYGNIIHSVTIEDFCSGLQQDASKNKNTTRSINHHKPKHNLVIVNSIEKAIQLIDEFHVSRVCYLELTNSVPKQLLA